MDRVDQLHGALLTRRSGGHELKGGGVMTGHGSAAGIAHDGSEIGDEGCEAVRGGLFGPHYRRPAGPRQEGHHWPLRHSARSRTRRSGRQDQLGVGNALDGESETSNVVKFG